MYIYIFVLIHALITGIHVPNEMTFVINKLTNCVGNVKRWKPIAIYMWKKSLAQGSYAYMVYTWLIPYGARAERAELQPPYGIQRQCIYHISSTTNHVTNIAYARRLKWFNLGFFKIQAWNKLHILVSACVFCFLWVSVTLILLRG